MGTKNKQVDAYIAKAAPFAKPILNYLRKTVHEGCPAVEEAIKWGMPSFLHKGILCGMAAFKAHCTFGFWKGDLLFAQDPAAKEKAAQAMGHFGRITALADLPPREALLAYVKEAARLNDAGIKAPAKARSKPKPLLVPDYFSAALNQNKKAKENFERFSYSHKREYVEWVGEAKREETREKRLRTSIAWLAQGKPQNWKYMSCLTESRLSPRRRRSRTGASSAKEA
jgi:uncharacterized protein YdeI (YjbR/CyaY-like superfamily)